MLNRLCSPYFDDYGVVTVFNVCLGFCVVYDVAVCVNVCGVVCVVFLRLGVIGISLEKTLEKSLPPYKRVNIPNTPTQHGYKTQHSTVASLHTVNNTVPKGFNLMPPPYIL